MRYIAFCQPDIGEEEIEEVVKVLRSGWITTGPRTKTFEKKLAVYVGLGTNNVACLSSATAAMELNLRMLGIGTGDEVIVPAYTYTSTAAAAIHVGATVLFVDSRAGSWEMDYDQLEDMITDRTKAVIPVDIAGVMCDYKRIYEVVEKKRGCYKPSGHTELGQRIQKALGRVAVVADCAHSLGARIIDDSGVCYMAGSVADFSSFSFHAVKNLTTAEGGVACFRGIAGIDDEEIYRQYQLMSLHGQSRDALTKKEHGSWEYDIIGAYYKCNMTDIQAAIGLKQLERYEGQLERRRQIIARYDNICEELGVEHLNHVSRADNIKKLSSGHLYITRVPDITEQERGEVIRNMSEHGVSVNVHYKPLPMMTAYKAYGYDIKNFPNAYDYYHNEITLPLHTLLTDDDVEYVCEVLKKYLTVR